MSLKQLTTDSSSRSLSVPTLSESPTCHIPLHLNSSPIVVGIHEANAQQVLYSIDLQGTFSLALVLEGVVTVSTTWGRVVTVVAINDTFLGVKVERDGVVPLGEDVNMELFVDPRMYLCASQLGANSWISAKVFLRKVVYPIPLSVIHAAQLSSAIASAIVVIPSVATGQPRAQLTLTLAVCEYSHSEPMSVSETRLA